MDCVCGNPEGTNKECERCRLLARIALLEKVIMNRDRCTTCGMALDDDGQCEDCYVSPEAQKRHDAMERGDELRDRAKDERAERKRR